MNLRKTANERILLLDGAMGTMVQNLIPGHKGITDLMNIEKPDVIREIHRRYLEAGADIITTNTFSSQQISMREFGMQDRIRELNLAGVGIARKIADEYTTMNSRKPRFVAGSVGPTTRMATAEGRTAYLALRDAYQEQMEAMIEGGVDAILIETILDMASAEAACEAARYAMEKVSKSRTERGLGPVELMLSMTLANNSDGKTYSGHSMDDLIRLADKYDVMSVGLNCSFGAEQMVPFVQELAAKTSRLVSAYPNAGLPDANGNYAQTPDLFTRALLPLVRNRQLDIVGGCCGTTDEYIRCLSSLL